MNRLKTFFLFPFLLILVGCSTLPEVEKTVLLTPPKELLQKQSDLSKIPLDTVLDVVVSYVQLVTDYYNLLDTHNALVDWHLKMEKAHGKSK